MKNIENIVSNKKTVVAIGKFDGVHMGHARLLKESVSIAEAMGALSIALIISDNKAKLIFPSSVRDELIKALGVDYIYAKELDCELMSMSAKEFIDNILINLLNCAHVIVGYNFRFAKGRSADADDLKNLCRIRKIGCTIIDKVSVFDKDGIEYTASSSNVRSALADGNVKNASLILGRNYFVKGRIEHGRKIGRTIDFPTANIYLNDLVYTPSHGVYKTRSTVSGKKYNSISNVGVNPTVKDDNKVSVETHIVDFEKNIYNSEMCVEFIDKIREEKKFPSLEKLKEQIKKDINYTKEME